MSERQDVKTGEREILRARVIELENALADIETSDLTIAVQERAEFRQQRDALALRLLAKEQECFALRAERDKLAAGSTGGSDGN